MNIDMDIVTIFIALLALAVSIYNYFESLKNNRIGSSPYITGQEYLNSDSYEYWVANKGNGVAIVDSVEYFLGEEQCKYKAFKENLDNLLKEKDFTHTLTFTRLGDEIVIAAGERILIGRVIFPAEKIDEFKGSLEQEMNICIKYHSAHGEHKVFNSNN